MYSNDNMLTGRSYLNIAKASQTPASLLYKSTSHGSPNQSCLPPCSIPEIVLEQIEDMAAEKIEHDPISSSHSSEDSTPTTKPSPLKEATVVDEELQKVTPSQQSLDDDPVFSYAEQRKIIHKVDRRLVLMLGFMYCKHRPDLNHQFN